MSTETPDRAHDPARGTAEDDEGKAENDEVGGCDTREVKDDEGGGSDARTGNADAPSLTSDADEELTVVVCPQRVYEQLRSDLGESHERLCREYQREYADLLAERARLKDEVARLERQVQRTESRLGDVCARNEEILAERTESYRRRLDGQDGEDDFVWTGRKQEAGLLARLKNWLR